MSLLRLCLSLALLVTFTLAKYPSRKSVPAPDINGSNSLHFFADKKKNYRLSTDVKPIKYIINFEVIDNDLENYSANAEIHIKPQNSAKLFNLHAHESLNLTEAIINEAKDGEEVKIKDFNRDNETDIVTYNLETELNPNKTYILSIKFESKVRSDGVGFYRGSYFDEQGNKKWYAATQFEPVGARRAFPCFDEPALKARFNISIECKRKYHVISNMPSITEEKKKANKNTRLTTFEGSPEMSTYLVAFAITEFKKIGNESFQVWARKELIKSGNYAHEIGQTILSSLAEYTHMNYTLTKMDQIALPYLEAGAMENWGLVTYKERALLYDKEINTTVSQQSVAAIIAHEFAHQWFGNLVTPKWWEFIWLNEGFATYFQYYIVDQINNNSWSMMDQFVVDVTQKVAFVSDAYDDVRPMNHPVATQKEISDSFDDIAYQKAGSVLRMISHILPKGKFQAGLVSYIEKMKYKVATSDDLLENLKNALDEKSDNVDQSNLKLIINSWLNQAGYPVITVKRDYQTNKVTLTQKRFLLEKSKSDDGDDSDGEEESENKWWIPISYADEDSINFNDTSPTVWFKPGYSSLEIEDIKTDGWIIFNVQQTGYYRVNYDAKNWKLLTNYLKVNSSNIHRLNRAQLIDDSFNLARVDQLSYDIALDLTKYLDSETDYIPWRAAFSAYSFLNRMLSGSDSYDSFKKTVANQVDKLLDVIKYDESDGDPYLTKLLRIEAIRFACDFGSVTCRNNMAEKVRLWLDDSEKNPLIPDLKSIALCAALRDTKIELWKAILNKYVWYNSTDDKNVILSALGCSLSPDILNTYLSMAIQPNSIFARPEAILEIVYKSSNTGLDTVLDFFTTKTDVIMSILPPTKDNEENSLLTKYLTDIGSRIVADEQLKKLKEFAAAKKVPNEVTQKGIEYAQKNNKWYRYYGNSIVKWYDAAQNPSIKSTTTAPKTNDGSRTVTFTIVTLIMSVTLTKLY